MKKIKILYGLEASGGGALKHVLYLTTRLNREKFEIHLLLSNYRLELSENDILKLKEHKVKLMFLPMKRNISLLNDIIAIVRVYKYINYEKFDIVHAHSSKAGVVFRIAAWLNQVPNIFYTPHCFYFQSKMGIMKYVFVIIEKIFAFITTAIIVSESEKNQIIKYKIIKPSKIVNINNAIDFNEYHQIKEIDVIKDKLNINKKHIIIGAIGRLVKQKDWKTYILSAEKVLERYKDVTFLIVGMGEQYNTIKKMIYEYDLEQNIILTGYINNITQIYSIIDIFVNTSLWEGLPYVILEAMKYELPVVATESGNENIVIHEETGFICAVKDTNYISSKIIKLIEDEKLAFKMGERGKYYLKEKHSFELFVIKHELLYQYK